MSPRVISTVNATHTSSPPAGVKPDSENYAKPQRVLSTLNADGSRRWLRPRVSPGRFLNARRVVAWVLIALFTILPYLKIGGVPVILLDLPARRFHILGYTFLPTDTILLALLLVGTFITIFLLTALLGRVWCGWACPQTVYMEFVFRPIERLFDGSPQSRRTGGFRGSGIAKALKYVAFFLVSFYLAHTFLAYFVGVEQLAQWVQRSPFEHPAGFLIVATVTALMMFDFCYFREQTCIVACPYGRFQSVMLDRHSLIISYDTRRGEPRGKKSRDGSTRSADVALPVARTNVGDCVDCQLCVATCPTGIDIRDGLQMECIGCAQCIDACDAVMDKIGRPRGLIRYSSQSAMAGERSRLLRPRVVVYPLALLVVISLFSLALAKQGDAYVTVLRGLGRPYMELPSGEIANTLRVKIINRTDRQREYVIGVEGVDGASVQTEDGIITAGPNESITVPAMIVAPFEAFTRGRCSATVVVSDGQRFSQRTPWQLQGPVTRSTHAPAAPTNRGDAP